MEDIKVGEWVRINNDFRLIALGIGKVIRINQDIIYVKMNFELPFAFKIENISKHSKNIIDLIEVGDYVNGYKVDFVQNNEVIYNENNPRQLILPAKEIKTILTHEQFEKNCYKVKGE